MGNHPPQSTLEVSTSRNIRIMTFLLMQMKTGFSHVDADISCRLTLAAVDRRKKRSPESLGMYDLNVIPSHMVRRNGSKKIETCLVWNRQKTRKVRAYLILPNVSYNLKMLVYGSPEGWSDKTFFQVDEKYYDERCSNDHDARLCKPRLVMETPTVGAVSEENNEYAIELPNWNWDQEIITFYFDTKHVSCESCNVICLMVKIEDYYSDNFQEYDVIYKEILFALHTAEE